LAGAYFVLHYEGGDPPDAMQKWQEAAERAVALAPDLAEGHIRLAQYEMQLGKEDVARVHFARATQLDPDDPLVLSMGLSDAIYEGRIADAIAIQRRVVAADPLSASHRLNLGAMLTVAGRLPEALTEMERSLELSPASESSLMGVADALILQGRADEAFKVIGQMPDGFRRDERLALAHFVKGEDTEGESLLGRMRTLALRGDADSELRVAIAEVYAFRKDADRAFEWLERARPLSGGPLTLMPGWDLRETIQATAYFNPIHADPRWNTFLIALDSKPQ
jgi:tetratricopeptide (TPR) repeat protein